MEQATITILGAGYVGLTTAVLLAHSGFKVYAVEPDPHRLGVIKNGRSFFYEEGIDILIKNALEKGTFIPTDSYEESIPKSSVIFSCVGTPDNPDGSSNLQYVFSAAEESSKYMQPKAIYVQKSTVPVGTGQEIQSLFKNKGVEAQYVSNPEFLREGTAILDTLYFDRVVAGSDNSSAAKKILAIYKRLEKYRDEIAQLANVHPASISGQYIATNLNSAELIKVTSNAFLALKISFANSIAKLADVVNADIKEVMNAVGADQRIGAAFLNAGRGYGGGCFPKDVSGLISSGLGHGVNLEIMEAVQRVNESMPGYIIEKVKNELGDLNGEKVAVLGLAFKKDTSDVRRSPGVAIANLLDHSGASVVAHDPKANEEALHDLSSTIHITDSLQDAISASRVIIVATDWAEFSQVPVSFYKQNSTATIIVDAVNCLDKAEVKELGITYIGVGR